jgi:hypothetical protein
MESNLVAEFIAETGADKTVAYGYLQGMEFYILELEFRFSHLRMCRASQSKKGFGSDVYHSIPCLQYALDPILYSPYCWTLSLYLLSFYHQK